MECSRAPRPAGGRGARRLATAAVCALAATSACGWSQGLDDSVRAVDRSRASIDANTAAAARSAGQIAELRSSVESLQGLQVAVAQLSTLVGPLNRLGDLDRQLEAVARLGPALDQLGALNAALDRVSRMAPILDGLGHMDRAFGDPAILGELRTEMSALREQLAELSRVRDAMHELLALREDLRSVGSLREPMTRLGSLVEPMTRLSAADQWLEPRVMGVAALLWGTLTLFATMIGVFLGHRIGRR